MADARTGNVVALLGSMVAAGLLVRRGRHPEQDVPAGTGDEFEVWRLPPQNIPAAFPRTAAAPPARRRAPVAEPTRPQRERPPARPVAPLVEAAVAPAPAPPVEEPASAPADEPEPVAVEKKPFHWDEEQPFLPAYEAELPPAPPPAPAAPGGSGHGRRRFAAAAAVAAALALALTFTLGPAVIDDPDEPHPASAAPPVAPAPPAQTDLVPRDVAETAGIAWSGPTSGESCVFDYDRDGVDDLFLTTGGALYAGRPGGRFARTNASTFPARDRQGCATGDFDGDGRLDVYASVGRCAAPCTSADELWIQKPDGSFADRSEEFGLTTPGGRGRPPVTLDANADDRPDLFTTQGATAISKNRNRLWVNRTGRRFVNPPGLPSAAVGIGCGTSGDVDEDGDDELFVCGGADGEFFLRAYENRGGRWSQANGRLALPDHGRTDAELGHMDGDGLLDLVLVSPTALEIRLNRDGRFPRTDHALPLQAGRDVAIADADGDGARDIYVVQAKNGEVPDLLLLNRGGGTRFSSVRDLPQAEGGEGDTVQALPDYRGTRRAGFLVGNGLGGKDGPRQLIQLTAGG